MTSPELLYRELDDVTEFPALRHEGQVAGEGRAHVLGLLDLHLVAPADVSVEGAVACCKEEKKDVDKMRIEELNEEK